MSIQIVPQNTIAIIINGLFIAVAVMVCAAYGPPLIRSLRGETPKEDQYLLSGILTIWIAISASRVWSLALIMSGKPLWMINHWFPTFCYLVAAGSGYYFLQISVRSKLGRHYTALAIVIAVAVATLILAFFES